MSAHETTTALVPLSVCFYHLEDMIPLQFVQFFALLTAQFPSSVAATILTGAG
jgi:hypothetical protein